MNERKYEIICGNCWFPKFFASGWSYEDCLPYFKKAQTHSDGGDDYRGDDGPLHVTRYKGLGELDQAWLKAGQQAGTSQGNKVRRNNFLDKQCE